VVEPKPSNVEGKNLLARNEFIDEILKLHCDASKVRIRAILSLGGRLVAYFGEKLSGSKRNYSTYDVEFYAFF
jgi:hypothetical protein